MKERLESYVVLVKRMRRLATVPFRISNVGVFDDDDDVDIVSLKLVRLGGDRRRVGGLGFEQATVVDQEESGGHHEHVHQALLKP